MTTGTDTSAAGTAPAERVDRAELAFRHGEATAGRWETARDIESRKFYVFARVPLTGRTVEEPVAVLDDHEMARRNGALICAAVNAVPGLLAALARAEAQRDEARRELAAARAAPAGQSAPTQRGGQVAHFTVSLARPPAGPPPMPDPYAAAEGAGTT